MARFMIAAAHKSTGKTVVSTGLAAALSENGLSVQCFKKGPDYIDPMWLSAASNRPCYNLDFNTMDGAELQQLLAQKSQTADLALIEANKGLFDGVDVKGSDSNAELAKQLKTPVVLVVDCMGMTRGIAPLLIGYQAFDPLVDIAGVILNKVGGSRHESKLIAAIKTYADIPVIGSVGNNPALDIGERHLGLTTPAETGNLKGLIKGVGNIVRQSIDLHKIQNIAQNASALQHSPPPKINASFTGLKIAVARDSSFGFYYPDDLQAFENLGAKIIPFDTMKLAKLPDADGLFIGGGFPEMKMAELSQNKSLLADIKDKILAGLPTYAECGGLMYLCENIKWNGAKYPMCGVVSGDAVLQERPQGRGYTCYRNTSDNLWGSRGRQMPAHEFHYARIDNLSQGTVFAREILRGHGIDGESDGLVLQNLVAGFCHLRNTTKNPWVSDFLAFVSQRKRQN